MRLPGLSLALLLGLILSMPSWAQDWSELDGSDGYISGETRLAASGEPQPASRVVATASAFLGIPYVWAGHSPVGGFDCSGYIYEVMRLNGYEVPRMADSQFYESERVSREDLRPGDMVFFTTYLPGPSHAGIYLGDGKFIHASSAAEAVVISQLDTGYYQERFLGGGRPDGWVGGPAVAASERVPSEQSERRTPPEFVVDSGRSFGFEPSTPTLVVESRPALFFRPESRASRNRSFPVGAPVETEVEAVAKEWQLTSGEMVALGRLEGEKLLKALDHLASSARTVFTLTGRSPR